MPGRVAFHLTKIPDLLDRQIIASEVQPSVEEHAAVTGRKYKTVAIDPAGMIRMVV